MIILTTSEVAERLKVSTKTVRNLIDAGKIVAFRFGKEYRVDENDLEFFIERSKVSKSE